MLELPIYSMITKYLESLPPHVHYLGMIILITTSYCAWHLSITSGNRETAQERERFPHLIDEERE